MELGLFELFVDRMVSEFDYVQIFVSVCVCVFVEDHSVLVAVVMMVCSAEQAEFFFSQSALGVPVFSLHGIDIASNSFTAEHCGLRKCP